MKNYLIGFFIILILILISFLFIGNKSIFTYLKLKKELNQNNQILETYKKETKELQENVKKLKIETLDLDYLDEVARDKHDLSKPDENIIFNK